jgi:hypothetical protein
MLKQRTETQNVTITEDVICNKCKRSCRCEDWDHAFEFVEIKQMWGYLSRKDLEVHRSHLCESCYDELIASFAIPPEVRFYHAADPLDPFDSE